MMLFAISLTNAEAKLRMLVLADIHYDPLYEETSATDDCRMKGPNQPAPFGRYGCDSPKKLVDLVLQTTGEFHQSSPFDVVLSMGDFPAHGLKDIHTPIKYMTDQLAGLYPGAVHAFVVGNNEGNGNYNFSFEVDDPHLGRLYDEDGIGLLVGNESFKRCGFYSKEVAGGEIVVLGLNTVMLTQTCYNKYHKGQPVNPDPCGQFEWFKAELEGAKAAGKQVFVVHHASLGVNAYNSQPNTLDEYTETYKQITAQFPGLVIAEVIGHYHQDQFRFHTHGRMADIPGFLCPSVSLSNGNNPGFRVLELAKENGTWHVADYEQYYMDVRAANANASAGLPVKFEKQYRFSSVYRRYLDDLGHPGPSVRNLQRINNAMHQDQQLYSIWSSHASMLYKPNRSAYICTITAATAEEYAACLAQYPSENFDEQ